MASPSNPGFVTGQVPTAAQWNSYFTAKADYNGDGSFATLEVSGASVLTGTLTANGAVSGSGITALFASPPAIGGTAPNDVFSRRLYSSEFAQFSTYVDIGFGSANYLVLDGAASGSSPTISAAGSDTNINLVLAGKGTGFLESSSPIYMNFSYPGPGNMFSAYEALHSTAATFPNLFSVSSGIGGSATSGNAPYYYQFIVNSDSAALQAVGGSYSFVAGTTIVAGATGNRVGMFGNVLVSQTTGNVAANNAFYTGGYFTATADANDNGVAGTPAGSIVALNTVTQLSSAATYWKSAGGAEIDINILSGASVDYKIGLLIAQGGNSAVAGSLEDTAITVTNNSTGGTAVGWSLLYGVGSAQGWFPVSATGTIFGTKAPLAGGPAYACAYGIDLSAVTFSTAFLKSTGFVVTGSGAAYSNLTTATVTASTGTTLTAAQVVGSVIFRTNAPTGAFTDTTDTATNIVAAIPGATVNASWILRYVNRDNNVCTLAGGTGVTISGTATIANNTWRDFLCQITNIGTPAVTMTSMGSGTAT